MNTKNKDAVICVFCMTVISEKMEYSSTMWCQDCNEYKGLTTIREYEAEYQEKFVIA